MRDLKEDRSVIAYIILGALTFGLYDIWYLHNLTKDVNELCRESGKKIPNVLVLLVLGILTFGLYGIFWWFKLADMLSEAAKKRNINESISGGYIIGCFVISYFICGIGSWLAIHKVFKVTNTLAEDYNLELRRKKYYEHLENSEA